MAKRGRKPTGVTRITTSFTIASAVHAEFDKYCKQNHLNKSSIVSSLIAEYLESVKRNVPVPLMDTETFKELVQIQKSLSTPSNPAKVMRIRDRKVHTEPIPS